MLYLSQDLVAVKCGLHIFIAAIEAMKNAHKEEMEKTHRSQLTGLNSDIDELRLQYEYVFEKIFSDILGEAEGMPVLLLENYCFIFFCHYLTLKKMQLFLQNFGEKSIFAFVM